MVWDSILGEMAASMKVSTNSIKNMVMVLILGQMGASMSENG